MRALREVKYVQFFQRKGRIDVPPKSALEKLARCVA
jgi:hypothetical protein